MQFRGVNVNIWTDLCWVNDWVQAFIEHGEIEEGAVIYDKVTGKSRGYGFVTFKDMESAQTALKAPSKMIDVSILVHTLQTKLKFFTI